MRLYTTWDFNRALIINIRRRGLQEEEGLSWDSIVELLCVLGKIAPNSYDLAALCAEEVSHCVCVCV